MQKDKQFSTRTDVFLLYAAWSIALVAMVGSLFFSEVMNLPPCVLCWYQRIAMYPLVLIIGIGISANDLRMKKLCIAAMFGRVCNFGLSQSVVLRFDT